MFHKHKWIKIKETYAPPHAFSAVSAPAEFVERALKGLTTILWECSVCSQIRREEMLGVEKGEENVRQ